MKGSLPSFFLVSLDHMMRSRGTLKEKEGKDPFIRVPSCHQGKRGQLNSQNGTCSQGKLFNEEYSCPEFLLRTSYRLHLSFSSGK